MGYKSQGFYVLYSPKMGCYRTVRGAWTADVNQAMRFDSARSAHKSHVDLDPERDLEVLHALVTFTLSQEVATQRKRAVPK